MLDRFRQAAEAVGTVVKQFSSVEEGVSYLKGLAGKGAISRSSLPASISNTIPVAASGTTSPADATLCISMAKAGIAATGTLLIDLQSPEGRAATALAPKHAVFLDPSTIVATLYDLEEHLSRMLTQDDQTYFSLTTGPSRTADIERVLTIGVHGPKELHILIIEGFRHE